MTNERPASVDYQASIAQDLACVPVLFRWMSKPKANG
jgi:hypothetical protein